MHLSFALSITHFFSSAGGDAGFAALVGLAILVLLYFAHARETSTLRDQLAAAMQRIEQLERRLTGTAPASIGATQPGAPAAPRAVPVAAPPAAASASASSPAPAGASSAAVSEKSPSAAPAVSARPLTARPLVAPAGVGAPPLSDATRVVPLPEPAGESAVLPGAPAAVPADRASAPGALPTDRAVVPGTVPAVPAAVPAVVPADRRAVTGTVPGERAVVPGTVPAVPGDRGAPSGDGLGATPSPMTGTTPAPVTAAAGGNGVSAAAATGGVAGAPRSLLEHGLPGQKGLPRWLFPVLAVVLAAVVAAVLVLVLQTGSSPHKTAVVHRHHAANIAAAPAGVVPSAVTVAVVNGTTINQLAHHVADRLTGQGFKEGMLATATNQSHNTTTVGYLPGHRNDALAVAHELKLPASAVGPASQSSEGLVCPTASSCTADVIVVAGSNLAPKR